MLAFCSVVTRSHVGFVAALAQSIRTHHPAARIHVLGVDLDAEEAALVAESFGVNVFRLADVTHERTAGMVVYYTAAELCAALKAPAIEHVLKDRSVEKVILLDTDTLVFGSFDKVVAHLDHHDIVVTPHNTKPFPADGLMPGDMGIYNAGWVNAGFLAVRRSEAVDAHLAWLTSRLIDRALICPAQSMYAEQRWFSMLAVYAGDRCKVLRDPEYNVAYWNLHERVLSRIADGGFLVDGEPLVFFHFSGYSVAKPDVLSRYSTRSFPDQKDAIAAILAVYREALESVRNPLNPDYRFAIIQNIRMTDNIRRHFFLKGEMPSLATLIAEDTRNGQLIPSKTDGELEAAVQVADANGLFMAAAMLWLTLYERQGKAAHLVRGFQRLEQVGATAQIVTVAGLLPGIGDVPEAVAIAERARTRVAAQ